MRRRDADETGAVTIIVAISLMVLLTGLALSIDIGAMRADRRSEQATSDFAALAAYNDLDLLGAYAPVTACQSAWDYAVANLVEAPTGALSNCAADFAALTSSGCTGATAPVSSSASAGPYVITITTPVPDGHPLMQGRLDPEVDGWSCERLAVTIQRDREHLIAGTFGNPTGASSAAAVVRAFALGEVGEFASLIVLDRTGCQALFASGQGAVLVENVIRPDGSVLPGYIALDSTGSGTGHSSKPANCQGNNDYFVVDAKDANCNNPLICGIEAQGAIFSYAERLGVPGPGLSHDPCDVDQGTGTACQGKPVRVDPIPIPGALITRAPIDHTFNCKPSYPLASELSGPLAAPAPHEAIEGCEDSAAPHIDNLVTAFGTAGSNPGGHLVFPNDLPGASCSPGTPLVVPSGSWWVNCPGNPGFTPGADVTFEGPGTVVFEGGIETRNNAIVRINTTGAPDQTDSIVYVRNGDIRIGAQTTFEVNHSMVYLHNGVLSAGGGDGPLTMTSPVGPAADAQCEAGDYVGMPPASCFEDLVLWSNSIRRHTLGGQAPLALEGVLFTPNAGRPCSGQGCGPFILSGQANQTLRHAQFVSFRLEVTGQGIIRMSPDPERNVETPVTGGGLIR